MMKARSWIKMMNHTYYVYPNETSEQFVERVASETRTSGMKAEWTLIEDAIEKLNSPSKDWANWSKNCDVFFKSQQLVQAIGIEEPGTNPCAEIELSDRASDLKACQDYFAEYNSTPSKPWEPKSVGTVEQFEALVDKIKNMSGSIPKQHISGQKHSDIQVTDGITTISMAEYHTRMFSNNYAPEWFMDRDDGDEQEEEVIEEQEEDLSKDFDFIKVKEIQKIKLDPGEALIIKLPKDTSFQDAERTYQYVVDVLKTDRVLIFVGDIEFTKADYSAHAASKKHPLY